MLVMPLEIFSLYVANNYLENSRAMQPVQDRYKRTLYSISDNYYEILTHFQNKYSNDGKMLDMC